MIDSTYSHVADDYKFMLEQAKKDVTPSNAGASEQKGDSAPPKKARKRKSQGTPESALPRNESPLALLAAGAGINASKSIPCRRCVCTHRGLR
jgi:hypothetical protein